MNRNASVGLAFELTPVPDELLYGWLARHFILLRAPDTSTFCKELLGRASLGGSPLLPVGLRILPSRLPSRSHDLAGLLSRHTGLPYFSSFGSPERIAALTEGMADGWIARGSRVIGTTTVTARKSFLYCRICRDRQVSELGAATWNRVHQCPGVVRCHVHDEPLMSSCIAVQQQRFVSCPTDDTNSNVVETALPIESSRRIARLTALFMWHPRVVTSRAQLRAGVTNLLAAAGWLHESGHARARLWETFAGRIGEAALEELGCGDVKKKSTSWIHDLIGAHTVGHHPLRYLLLFDFLELDADDLAGFPPPTSEVPSTVVTGGRARSRADVPAPSPELLAHYRAGIMSDRREGLTRALIQKKFAVRFRAMMAHDRVWLDEHAPLPPPPLPRGRKDVSEQDERYTHVIAAAIARLALLGDARPRRRSIRLIAEEACLPSFYSRRSRLPKSLALAQTACQTAEEHMIDALRWAAARYRVEGWSPSFKIFVKRAGFPPERFPHLRELARRIHSDIATSPHRSSHVESYSE